MQSVGRAHVRTGLRVVQHVPELRRNRFADQQLRVQRPKTPVLQCASVGAMFDHGESRLRGRQRAGEGRARRVRL